MLKLLSAFCFVTVSFCLPPTLCAETTPVVTDGYAASGLRVMRGEEIRYYYIAGSTSAEISEALSKRGPSDYAGINRWGYTDWRITWKAGDRGWINASCKFTATVTVPLLLKNPLQSETIATKWYAFTQAIGSHEQQHLSRLRSKKDLPCDAIRRAATKQELSSSAAHAVALAATEEIRQEERLFDKGTDHGKATGVIW